MLRTIAVVLALAFVTSGCIVSARPYNPYGYRRHGRVYRDVPPPSQHHHHGRPNHHRDRWHGASGVRGY